MVEELIDKTKLLERINLQNGIYGMNVDEIIEFIKKTEVVEGDTKYLEEEIEDLEDRIRELE